MDSRLLVKMKKVLKFLSRHSLLLFLIIILSFDFYFRYNWGQLWTFSHTLNITGVEKEVITRSLVDVLVLFKGALVWYWLIILTAYIYIKELKNG